MLSRAWFDVTGLSTGVDPLAGVGSLDDLVAEEVEDEPDSASEDEMEEVHMPEPR